MSEGNPNIDQPICSPHYERQLECSKKTRKNTSFSRVSLNFIKKEKNFGDRDS